MLIKRNPVRVAKVEDLERLSMGVLRTSVTEDHTSTSGICTLKSQGCPTYADPGGPLRVVQCPRDSGLQRIHSPAEEYISKTSRLTYSPNTILYQTHTIHANGCVIHPKHLSQ